MKNRKTMDSQLEKARAKVASLSLEEASSLYSSLETSWADSKAREEYLLESLKDIFRFAGATEGELLNLPALPMVRLNWFAQLRMLRIANKQEKLAEERLDLMCLAVATDERIAMLTSEPRLVGAFD